MNAFWFPAATIALTLVAQASYAAETAWVDTGKAQVRLHSDATRTAVEIRMLPKWHTYWRYPGDAGVPPRFDWSSSENLASAAVHFPAPLRIKEAAGQVIGYKDQVLFPVTLKPADSARAIKLRLKFDFAVCEKICIPAEANLSLDIPPGEKSSPAIDAAQAALPGSDKVGSGKTLSVQSVKLARGTKPQIFVDVLAPEGQSSDLFVEGPTDDWYLPLPEKISSDGNRARYVIPVDGAPPGAAPVPASLRLTLTGGGKAIEPSPPLD